MNVDGIEVGLNLLRDHRPRRAANQRRVRDPANSNGNLALQGRLAHAETTGDRVSNHNWQKFCQCGLPHGMTDAKAPSPPPRRTPAKAKALADGPPSTRSRLYVKVEPGRSRRAALHRQLQRALRLPELVNLMLRNGLGLEKPVDPQDLLDAGLFAAKRPARQGRRAPVTTVDNPSSPYHPLKVV